MTQFFSKLKSDIVSIYWAIVSVLIMVGLWALFLSIPLLLLFAFFSQK